MTRSSFTLFATLIPFFLLAQESLWLDQSVAPDDLHARSVEPNHYRVVHLNEDLISKLLQRTTLDLEIPMPNGENETFEMTSEYRMHPNLAKKYPGIRSFTGVASNGWQIRADYSIHGFSAVIRTDKGEIYIDPYYEKRSDKYIVYHTSELVLSAELMEQYRNYHDHAEHTVRYQPIPKNSPFKRQKQQVSISVYEAAIATTAEYTAKHGGTVEGALAAVNTALGRINFLLETEVNTQLQLIENNDELIFLNSQSDPFTNGNAGMMAAENNNYLLSNLGINNYDVGHVFGIGCVGVVGTSGGVGTVCQTNKGFGSSCEISTNDRFYIGIVCHELGHQLGAEHTWNNCPGSEDQINTGTAFEPGGGSTIMSYSGACGDQSFIFDSDPYYHNNSIEAIRNYVKDGPGRSCSEELPTNNQEPIIETGSPDTRVVPISTALLLQATASDPDGNSLTYCWEQYDAGIGQAAFSPIGSPVGSAPLFRSLPPTEEGFRYFPQFQDIIANTDDPTETLPDYERDLTFRITVRDNVLNGGGVTWEELKYTTTTEAGPFVLENLTNGSYTVGDSVVLTWDVANTDQAPVNCQLVDIWLHTNDEQNPIRIAQNVFNDGNETVILPNISSPEAYIRIQAVDNIFLDITELPFVIQETNLASFSPSILTPDLNLCLPTSVQVPILVYGLGDFEGEVIVDIVDEPDGVVVANAGSIPLNDTFFLELELSEDYNGQQLAVTFNNAEFAVNRVIDVRSLSTTFGPIAAVSPTNAGDVSQRPNFEWTAADGAASYQFELSKDPTFAASIVSESFNSTVFSINDILDAGEVYYWRVTPTNDCGNGKGEIFAFQTRSLVCEEVGITQDFPITQSAAVELSVELEIPTGGEVVDVNLTEIRGFHEAFGNLRMRLEAPDGTSASLFTEVCGISFRNYELGFDDDASEMLNCQVAFNDLVFQPEESFSVFNGLDKAGTWKLHITDSVIGGGGILQAVSLEVCGFGSNQPLELVNNIPLIVESFGEFTIGNESLLTTDGQSGAENILYTLTNIPQNGSILLNGIALSIGSTFTQQQIDNGLLTYRIDAASEALDSFQFTALSNTGNWLPLNTFQINLDLIVSSTDQRFKPISLFPNPNKGTLIWTLPLEESWSVYIYDLQGKLSLRTDVVSNELNLQSLTNGTYLLIARNGFRNVGGKLVLQK